MSNLYTEILQKSAETVSIFDRAKNLIATHATRNDVLIPLWSESVGKPIGKIVSGTALESIESLLDDAIKYGQRCETEFSCVYANRVCVFRAQCIPLSDATYAVVLSEIQNHQFTQNENLTANRTLFSVLERIPIFVVLKDLETREYIFWNRKCKETTGIDAKEVIGKTDRMLFPEKMARSIEVSDDQLYADGIPQRREEKICYGGVEYDTIVEKSIVRINGTKYIIATRWNVTELKQAKEQLQIILDNSDTGFVFLSEDYHVLWENISNITSHPLSQAYKRGELCYKTAFGRTSPCEDCAAQRAICSKSLETLHIPTDNGCNILSTAIPVWKESKLQGIVLKIEDITQMRRQEIELKAAKERAEISDRLKSAFLANMSHEIRTPLNAIVGFSRLLQSADDEQEKAEYINIINQNNDQLLRLIGDILDLSKIESGVVEHHIVEFDLAEFFGEIEMAMRQRMKNPEVQFLVENPYDHCILHGDKGRLMQLITNFVTNAIKYTPKGYIKMGYCYENGGVKVYVEDTGIGIAEHKKPKIFQRFEKLDEFAQGTGLGLSICKAIAESCGGSVGFDSKLNIGSTFWAFWPLDAVITQKNYFEPNSITRSAKPACEEPKQPAQADCEDLSVLVAESNDANYKLIHALLKQNRVERAANGAEALAMASQQRFDVILIDMKVPIMSGADTIRHIRAFDPNVPIIALTANAFEADRPLAFDAGCNAFLTKPLVKEQLETTLHNLLNEAKG